jgi:hypothetical protein
MKLANEGRISLRKSSTNACGTALRSTSYNGGTWSYGDIWAGGWFWADNSRSCVHPVKRDALPVASVPVGDINAEMNGTTLADGMSQVGSRLWLDFSPTRWLLLRRRSFSSRKE